MPTAWQPPAVPVAVMILADGVAAVIEESGIAPSRRAEELDWNELVALTKRFSNHGFHGGSTDRFAFDANAFSYHSRAYLKIQDGCDNACAYCRVHIARGKAVDLDAETIVERALRLEEKGFHEG